MCIILACESARPSYGELEDAEAANRDGMGIASFRPDGSVRWIKGLDSDQAYSLSREAPFPFVIHARLATVGGAVPGLTHPFPIERIPRLRRRGSAGAVLFHNGHVSEWRTLLLAAGVDPKDLPGEWSDSRAIAHLLAMRPKLADRILGDLSDYNRFAVLTAGKLYRRGSWTSLRDGIMASSALRPSYSYSDWRRDLPDVDPDTGLGRPWPKSDSMIYASERDDPPRRSFYDDWEKCADGIYRRRGVPSESEGSD